MDLNIDNDRKNGIYYTPSMLADFLAGPLIKSGSLKILDPAYGEGSLLLAAEKIAKVKKNEANVHLFGCDTKPVNGLLEHLPEANLKKLDFFDYSTQNKFDLVLMNPPYVRHHFQNNDSVQKYREKYPDLRIISMKADLWSYFMVKAVLHLTHNGSIGAILPWSFLQADYAQSLRKWLAQSFRRITVVKLNQKYFSNAEARVVLVWLTGYGYPAEQIKIADAQSLTDKMTYTVINRDQWHSDKIVRIENLDFDGLIKIYKERHGFAELDKYCEIRIGIVTGADGFFLLSANAAKGFGFKRKTLVPMLSNSREFFDVLNGKIDNLRRLPRILKGQSGKYSKYLQIGRKLNANKSAHAKRRHPWFSVQVGKMPDAFFPYRSSKTPFILPNIFNIQCTNSIHRLYFKNLTETEIKWVCVSLLSNIGQLTIEMRAKTYGKGMLKIEPGSLKNSLVVKSTDPAIDFIYDQIYQKLKRNDKSAALLQATDFINTYFQIENNLSTQTTEMLDGLFKSRLMIPQ